MPCLQTAAAELRFRAVSGLSHAGLGPRDPRHIGLDVGLCARRRRARTRGHRLWQRRFDRREKSRAAHHQLHPDDPPRALFFSVTFQGGAARTGEPLLLPAARRIHHHQSAHGRLPAAQGAAPAGDRGAGRDRSGGFPLGGQEHRPRSAGPGRWRLGDRADRPRAVLAEAARPGHQGPGAGARKSRKPEAARGRRRARSRHLEGAGTRRGR